MTESCVHAELQVEFSRLTGSLRVRVHQGPNLNAMQNDLVINIVYE